MRETLRRACQDCGRDPAAVHLLAVTKTFPLEAVQAAWEHGQRHFGENYVQEARGKFPGLPSADWHLIGPLQKNKMNAALEMFNYVHSIESVEQLHALDERAGRSRRKPKVFLQVRLGDEESKHGFDPDTFLDELKGVSCSHLTVIGLMTVPPPVEDAEENRPHFRRLRELCSEAAAGGYRWWNGTELSMGMSDDYPVAIQEGATWIRVGRAIFGSR